MTNAEPAPSGLLSNRRKFILVVGVLGWGVPCAILLAVLLQMRHGAAHQWYASWSFLGTLAVGLLLFMGGGVFFGAYLWERLGRRRAA